MGSSASIRINGNVNEDRTDLLCAAVIQGNGGKVQKLLAKGVNPNATINFSSFTLVTPLYLAAGKGDPQCTSALIDAGADPEVVCEGRQATPLHVAALRGHYHCLKILLNNGANSSVRDADDDTPLHAASLHGHVQCVLALTALTAHGGGVNVNATNRVGGTPLHYACHNGHVAVCRALRAAGADYNICDAAGNKPARLARLSKHISCAATLTD